MCAKRLKLFIVQALAVLAYLACAVLWVLMLLPYGPSLLESDAYKTFVTHSDSQPIPAPQPVALPPAGQGIVFVAAILLVIGVIAVTVMSFRRAPRMIGHVGQQLTRRTAEMIVPMITHHHKIPAKKRRLLTARIIIYIKLLIVIVPVLVVLFAPMPPLPPQLTRELLQFIAGLIAGWAILLFGSQLMLSKAFHIPPEQLW